MEDHSSKMSSYIRKELSSYLHGMTTGVWLISNQITWGALGGNDSGGARRSPSPSSESCSSTDEATAANLSINATEFTTPIMVPEHQSNPFTCVGSVPNSVSLNGPSSDVNGSFIPTNSIQLFPKLTRGQVYQASSFSSPTTSNLPNLTLYFQEQATIEPSTHMSNTLDMNQRCQHMFSSQYSFLPVSEFHQNQFQSGSERLNINQNFCFCFLRDDFWMNGD